MPNFKRSDTLNLHYVFDDFTDRWENRPFLLLQHGNGRSAAFWYRWVPHLAGRYRIIRPEMHGLTNSIAHRSR